MSLAWAPWFSHEYIAYFSVQAVDSLMALPPVPVKRNPQYGNKVWPVGPKHIDLYKESCRELRRLDPLWSFDYKKRNSDYADEPPSGKTIEPWKALVIYSTEPDLYPDYDLYLHKNQKITGGSHGWRHMQFRILGMTFGIAPQSFRVHTKLAALAFENGNDYWGWRYLSRCAHYLADLGHPFHVKALPGSFLIKKIFSRHDLFKIVSAMHQSYEVYVERRFREGFEPFKEALLRGAREGHDAGTDVESRLPDYIKRAEEKHNPLFYYFLDEFGRELLDAFDQMDPNSQLDAAAQTNRCSADAAKVIFKATNLPRLDYLDKITSGILFDVGRMLGMLLGRFSDRKMQEMSATLSPQGKKESIS
ncbi:MAG: hypothetical protein CVU55_15890 [Deltaproteobacteria bacterium HGW-Deltaproteobacteria-13]|nr:MAG: hypothetical protein CVU55_15890 [Deltaproteobacteria bacterium HGW-Deltaproteobacteria-13]